MVGLSDPGRKLRILIYANVEHDEAGGTQAVVHSLGEFLSARGHLVSTGWNSATDAGALAADNWVGHFAIRSGKRRWLHLPSLFRICALLLRERPDVVNIHFASASARYFYRLAPMLGYRTVLTCHGSDVLRPLPQDVPHLPAIIDGADTVTVVSQDIATRISLDFPIQPNREVTVIANGVDTTFWHPGRQRLAGSSARAKQIVAVGRLEHVKGFDLLIDALARLTAAGMAVKLTLIGEGSERAALETQVREAGLAERVLFAGRLPREDVRARLHAADLFVLSSRSEGTPLALLEAMATGMACVAARVGGVPVAADQAARIVAPEDPEALFIVIRNLLEDEPARRALADAARQRAFAFSADRTHRSYEALFIGHVSPVVG